MEITTSGKKASDAQVGRIAAKGFAENNLQALATDILIWRGGKNIPTESKMHELAEICATFSTPDDHYQEAERVVITKALEHASGPVATAVDR